MTNRADTWRRSTRCEANNCVEVGDGPDGRVLVRNSRQPEEVIKFSVVRWRSFCAAVKRGELVP